jgi:hypothetical protein
MLGVCRVMELWPLRDEESGLELIGISWQEGGTGDVYVAAALPFSVGCGNRLLSGQKCVLSCIEGSYWSFGMVPEEGFEPPTKGL